MSRTILTDLNVLATLSYTGLEFHEHCMIEKQLNGVHEVHVKGIMKSLQLISSDVYRLMFVWFGCTP